MSIDVEPRRSTTDAVGSLEPSHLWVLGLTIDEDGRLVGPGRRSAADWTECECPGDCLRDHENE